MSPLSPPLDILRAACTGLGALPWYSFFGPWLSPDCRLACIDFPCSLVLYVACLYPFCSSCSTPCSTQPRRWHTYPWTKSLRWVFPQVRCSFMATPSHCLLRIRPVKRWWEAESKESCCSWCWCWRWRSCLCLCVCLCWFDYNRRSVFNICRMWSSLLAMSLGMLMVLMRLPE